MDETAQSGLPDSVHRHWLNRFAPAWLVPYGRLARWDRPIGWWLLLWPCWWSVALAAIASGDRFPDVWHLLLFLIGAIAMRGAGCTYNDIVDREIDANVERTAGRPIPSGAVSVPQAIVFLVVQSLVGLAVLLQFNTYTILLGLGSLLVVAIYPFMKRITSWPQFVLGLAFSWGALVGWSAEFGSLSTAPLLLYAASIVWTIGYDTIYAHQDTTDDAVIGVRSTALLFANRTRLLVGLFYAATIILISVAVNYAGGGVVAAAGLVLAAVHMGWQVLTLNVESPENCLERFRANRTTGWIIFIALLMEAAAL